MPGHEPFDGISAERAATDSWKGRIAGRAGMCPQPSLECGDRIATKRRTAMFPAFPDATHMRAGAEHDVVSFQADQFRDAQAGLERDQEERAIPTANPGLG